MQQSTSPRQLQPAQPCTSSPSAPTVPSPSARQVLPLLPSPATAPRQTQGTWARPQPDRQQGTQPRLWLQGSPQDKASLPFGLRGKPNFCLSPGSTSAKGFSLGSLFLRQRVTSIQVPLPRATRASSSQSQPRGYCRLALYGRERFRRSGFLCLCRRPMLTPCRLRTEMFCSTRLASMPAGKQAAKTLCRPRCKQPLCTAEGAQSWQH